MSGTHQTVSWMCSSAIIVQHVEQVLLRPPLPFKIQQNGWRSNGGNPFGSPPHWWRPLRIKDSQSTLCCVAIFHIFLGKHVKGRLPLQKVIRPPPCPNPDPCVPKPKPTQMQWPRRNGSRHRGKHSPQSDGSWHGETGEAAKVSLHEDIFSAGAASSSTPLVLPRCVLFSRHACKQSKENSGREKVVGRPLPHL